MPRPLPAKKEELDREKEMVFLTILDELARYPLDTVAKRAIPGKGKTIRQKRRRWKHRILRLAANDPDFQSLMYAQAQGKLITSLGPMIDAMVGRAKRTGRAPEIKLAMEATGFHNPRVQHEHSGEVQITLKGIKRPERVVDEDDVVDAEVVED